MSILSVFDVIEVIWTPQNTYLINKMVSNSRVTRTGVVGRAVTGLVKLHEVNFKLTFSNILNF